MAQTGSGVGAPPEALSMYMCVNESQIYIPGRNIDLIHGRLFNEKKIMFKFFFYNHTPKKRKRKKNAL